tara:strand:+ start:1779 stop:2918 length:1140 start_codon:yes stop_codon:yes gene_type:complete
MLNVASLNTEFCLSKLIASTETHTGSDGEQLLMVSLRVEGSGRKHMGLALDYSTSMSDRRNNQSKRDVLVQAAVTALNLMPEDDMITVVAYGTHATVLMRNARIGHPVTIPKVCQDLRDQPFMGGTNPSSALSELRECDQILLVSDGEFNDGVLQPDLLHKMVGCPVLCGSILPGCDMSELANVSEGSSFEIDCNEADTMASLMASALSAPNIAASSVTLLVQGKKYQVPSVREGCCVRYVVPIPASTEPSEENAETVLFSVTHMDTRGLLVTQNGSARITGAANNDVERQWHLQKAAALVEEAQRTGCPSKQSEAIRMFCAAGVTTNKHSVLRTASSQRLQFSLEPDSELCPTVCRESSTRAMDEMDEMDEETNSVGD